jgi:hypothetical protein
MQVGVTEAMNGGIAGDAGRQTTDRQNKQTLQQQRESASQHCCYELWMDGGWKVDGRCDGACDRVTN